MAQLWPVWAIMVGFLLGASADRWSVEEENIVQLGGNSSCFSSSFLDYHTTYQRYSFQFESSSLASFYQTDLTRGDFSFVCSPWCQIMSNPFFGGFGTS